jgi:acetyl esterase
MTDVDPKTRILLDLMAASGEPPLAQQNIVDFRARRERGRELVNEPPPSLAVVKEVTVEGAAGPLEARIFDAEDGSNRPTLVYFHGGGFVYASIETHDPLCRRLSNDGGLRVISVDYRLAPEHPFPAGVEDAIAATQSILKRAKEYGVDAKRVAVGGDSAGACLATVVARHFAKNKIPGVAFQLLIYPVVQRDETPSRTKFASGYFLTKEAKLWFDGMYVRTGTNTQDERLTPLSFPTPKGLAPAKIVTAGFDPLLDEGRAYAEALEEAGVRVEYVEYPDQIHGFFNFTKFSSVAVEAIADAATSVRRALG